MAITDTQKVDYLWKKVGYGRAKTDVNSVKGATNESISSPLFTRGENVWSQADLIPGVMPATSGGVVTVYPTTAPVECIADTTATSNRTWKTQSIDWIPPEVGPTYLIKVYAHTSGQAGSAAASGTTLSAAETNEEWFFDYASGTLNFIGTNLPAEVAGNSIYISGAVYSGIKGVAVPGAGATFTTLGISSLTTFTDTTDNVLGDSNTGAVQIDGGLGVDLNVTVGAGLSVIGDATFDSNISLGQTETVTISGPENIIIDPHPVGVGTTSGNVYIQGDLYVQGRNFQVDSTTVNIADKVVGIATTCTDDILLDGAGLGIGTDGNRKTLLYHNASTSLKSSENFNIASGKVYQIDQTERLSADTLSLGTGTTIHSPASNTLILGTNSEERARITSDGDVGIGTTNPTAKLDVNGGLNVSGDVGIGITNPTAKLDVDGTLRVSGISTFASGTQHSSIVVTNVVTAFGGFNGNGLDNISGNSGDLTLRGSQDDAVAGPEFKLFRDSDSPADADYLGQIKFAGNSDTDVERDYAKITAKILDASDTDEDGALEFSFIKAGSENINALFKSTELQLLNGTNFSVAGISTFDSHVDINNTVDVLGISTFQDRVIFDNTNSIQIPVGTEAQKDAVGVAVTGQIRFNTTNSTFEGFGSGGQWGSLGGVKDVDGDTFIVAEESPGSDDDKLVFYTSGSSRVAIDSTGNVGIGTTTNISADLDVVGQTELDDLNVSGIATIYSLAADSAAIGDLTQDRVVIVGANGELGDSANLTFDGTKLTITDDVDVTESLTAKQVTADYYGEQHKSFIDIQVTSSASKTANHRYTGIGTNRSFLFDGDEAPYIQFVPGKTYRFDQVDSSNTNHRLKFYLESNKTTEYTTGVTYNGTPGAANAYTQIVVTKQTPSVLYYQSENHDRIGNEVSVVNSFSLLEHNLGIGTVNPLQALQVGTSENPFVVTSVGNVGIATTNPTADLDVVGLTELDNLNVSGISTLNILGVTGITTTQDFKVVGLSTFNDDINVSFGDTTSSIGIGTTTFSPKENHIVDIRGNVNIDGALIVDGANVGAEITAIGASLTNIKTGDLLVTGIATFGSASNIDVKNGIGITGGDVSIGTAGTGFYYDDSTAKVGIGITTPQYKLDVDGDVHVTGFTTTAKLTVGTGSSEYTFPEYDGVEGTFLRTDGDGNVDWYTNTTIRTTFNTTASAGQTTFNTTYTPGLIDVFLNGVKLSSSDYVASNGSSIVLNAAAYIGDILEVVKFNVDHVSSRPILDYWNGDQTGNIFNITDNVGIGTSAPTQLLDVDGDVRIRGGLYDSSDTSGDTQQVPVADGNGGWVWSAPPVIGVSTAGGSITQVQYHNAAGVIDGSNEFVFDYSSNEVGIGTTNPETKLDVRGGARLGNLSVSSAGVVTAVSGIVTYYGDGSNLTLLDGSNIASGTISSERLSGTYDISITGSIAGTNVDTTNLTVSNSAQFGPTGSGTTFVKIDNAGNLDVTGIGTISTLQLGVTTVGVSSILDEDDMVSDSDTALATQQSIKAYVDTEIDALSLSVKDDQAGSALTVDLSSETLIIEGTTDEIETTLTNIGGGSSDKKIKVGLPDDVTVTNIVTANAGFANTMTYSNTLIGAGNTTDQIILHSDLSVNTYRSVEYSIQVTQGSNFHFTKLLALHDGSNAYLTEYGTVFNTSNLATFDVDIAGGAIRLLATAGIGSTANYVVNFTTNKV